MDEITWVLMKLRLFTLIIFGRLEYLLCVVMFLVIVSFYKLHSTEQPRKLYCKYIYGTGLCSCEFLSLTL